MTVTIKEHITDNYYITMEWEKSNIYIVQACPIIGNLCGYPEKQMIYSINEKKNALATFNRYKKKYI
jgi:hypothetical protein